MWDERYRTDEYVYGTAPNDFLVRHCHLIPKGKVLCLAEGEGRNAAFLARQGYEVTAVDLSSVGLEKAQKLAAAHGVHIQCVHADLQGYALGENRWQGIVSIFCHLPPEVRRQLHSQVNHALTGGGVFLLEAYTPKQLHFSTGGPPDASLMMTKDVLQAELAGLTFDHLEELQRDVVEGSLHTGSAAVVQVVAVKAQRQYRVSSNRSSANHKVRYVESGGGEANGNCRVCQPAPKPR
jgi:SAM-dependent methyltransferase